MNSCPDSNLRKTNFSSEKFLSLITEWIHSEYSNYSLHPGPRSQEEAVALCSSIGKQLVEPRSVDTNAEIIALAQLEMMSGGYGVWIGIDDKSEEGSFKYASDGSPIHYTNWISGFYGYLCLVQFYHGWVEDMRLDSERRRRELETFQVYATRGTLARAAQAARAQQG